MYLYLLGNFIEHAQIINVDGNPCPFKIKSQLRHYVGDASREHITRENFEALPWQTMRTHSCIGLKNIEAKHGKPMVV